MNHWGPMTWPCLLQTEGLPAALLHPLTGPKRAHLPLTVISHWSCDVKKLQSWEWKCSTKVVQMTVKQPPPLPEGSHRHSAHHRSQSSQKCYLHRMHNELRIRHPRPQGITKEPITVQWSPSPSVAHANLFSLERCCRYCLTFTTPDEI